MPTAFIRPYRASDTSAVLDLINRVQPHLPWTPAYFRWQYEANPAGEARRWVVEVDGVPVALYAAVPHRFYTGQGKTLAWRVQDIMTDPAHRGQGWMHRLTAHGTAAIAAAGHMSYAFPREARATLRCFLKHNWVQACRIPFRLTVDLITPLAPEQDVQSISRFGPSADALWKRCRPALTHAFVRDADYLNWRFHDRPGAEYAAFGVQHADTLRGWIMMKAYQAEDGRRSAHFCDMLVEPNASDVMQALLAQAFLYAQAQGASLLSGWYPVYHPYAPHFDAAGLMPDLDFPQWLVAHAPALPVSSITDPQTWYLTVCDNDVY